MTTSAERPGLSRGRAFLAALIPGAGITMVVVAVAALLGGPIAAVLAGFVFVSVLLVNTLLMAAVVLWRAPRTRLPALSWGCAGYLAGLALVWGWLTWFGPSQIM